MVFKIDYIDDAVVRWETTDNGVTAHRDEDYRPVFFASTESADLDLLQERVSELPTVTDVKIATKKTAWRTEPERVIRVSVNGIGNVARTASTVKSLTDAGDIRCYNVDFSREFRYALARGIKPVPDADLDTMELTVPVDRLQHDHITPLTINDDTVTGTPEAVLHAVQNHVANQDPDVLIVNAAELIPALHREANHSNLDTFTLSRMDGETYQQLAGESTYESYGNVGHSPARYNVPGRVIIDKANTFFWDQTNLDGILDLVGRSHKPLQESAWASIGNVFTAIQIRYALDNDVLVPWKSWRHEFFKSMRTLHAADRGGFTFSPDTGYHENVHELDFSSLYPNIIVTRNVSPDTIRCDCHADRNDVPELGYSVCDDQGYLVDVLSPMIEDRDAIKARLNNEDLTDEEESELRGRSEALKWVLVSCFGYQGFSNAKFGRIECHEAINAYARDILLRTKETLEENGWRVVHGIVDSVWVTPRDGDEQTPLEDLCVTVTEREGIRLEYEQAYDWLSFVPRRSESGGALNRYFGQVKDTDETKIRGIECRQRSTPAFIDCVQRDLIDTFDKTRDPEAVCDVLQRELQTLRTNNVQVDDLVIKQRASKPVEAYSQNTRVVAALHRAKHCGLRIPPGTDVEYVVVDDSKLNRERVRLPHELDNDRVDVDVGFYEELLVRACESVLSPVGWDQQRINAYLSNTETPSLQSFA